MDSSFFFSFSNETHYLNITDFEPYVNIGYSKKTNDYSQNSIEIYDP
jgi:hypothetical protein